jgi:hypothetical protein
VPKPSDVGGPGLQQNPKSPEVTADAKQGQLGLPPHTIQCSHSVAVRAVMPLMAGPGTGSLPLAPKGCGRVQKHHWPLAIKYFCKKSMSKTFSKKIGIKFATTFPSTSFCFIAFSGVSQRRALQENRVEKFLQSNPQNKINHNRFFLDFFITFFERFSVRGVKKHDKEISGK